MTVSTAENNKSRNKKILIAALALIIVAFTAFKLFSGSNQDAGKMAGKAPAAGSAPVKVEAVKAGEESLTQKLNLVGSLTSNESAVISSEISGRVVQIPFTEGVEVKKGDVLFKLDDSVQKAQLAQAQANLALAQNNVKRYGGLVESGAISRVQLEQSQADLSLATANIELAKANLDKTTIRAPFDGVVGIRQVSAGNVVTNGQSLVNLEQMSPIRVQFTVPEKYVAMVKSAEKINLKTEAYPDQNFEAKVFAIDPRIDQNSRSISMQALAENTERKLFPGQFVSINVPIEQGRNVVTIPDQALVPMGGKNVVYTVVDGKAKKTEVKTGLRTNSKVEITEGIKAGDVVVTAGHQKIQDGSAVNVVAPTYVEVAPTTEEEQKISNE